MKVYGEVEALDRIEWTASPSWKKPQDTGERHLMPLPRIEPQYRDHATRSPVTILTELLQRCHIPVI
jgi:hypothetical protein